MIMPESIVNAGIRFITFITDMRKRDLLLVGFIFMFLLSIGVLTGQIPSPLLKAIAQHEILIDNLNEEKDSRRKFDEKILDISRLQLYLQRENCMHGAKTPSEQARCDRESVRSAILGDILPVDEIITPDSL